MNSKAKTILDEILMPALFEGEGEAVELVSDHFINASDKWIEKAEEAGFTTIRKTRSLVNEYIRLLDCGRILVEPVSKTMPTYFADFAAACGGEELSKFELYAKIVRSIRDPQSHPMPLRAKRIALICISSQDIFYFIDLYYIKTGKRL